MRSSMDLRNDRLLLRLDPDTGSILRVADARSGRIHFDASGDPERLGRLFRVILPVEGWSSHRADSWSSGPPTVSRGPSGATLSFPELRTARGPAGIEAEVEVRLPEGRSEAELTLRLRSRRDGDVTDVLFPWLGGWQGGSSGEGGLVLGGVRRVDPDSFPVNRGMTFLRWHQRESWTYPVDLYCPWVDLSGVRGGVGVLSWQREGRNLGAFAENLAGYGPGLDLSIGLCHYPLLRSGEEWTSPPVSILVHDGDWRATADRYAAWVDTWFTPPPTPAWARQAIGFQNVLFTAFDGTPIHRFEEIPSIAEAGIRAGVPHLCVWDYVLLGEYAKLDDVPQHGFPEDRRAALRRALTAARLRGAHVSSLQNYRLVKPHSRLFEEVAHAEVCRRYDGTPYVEEYCSSLAHASVITTHVGPVVHPVDARIASYRRRVHDLILRTLELGFDSHFYDQPFENLPSYHPGRGDDGPDGAHAATVSLLGEVRRVLARERPDGILVGEYCDVFASQAIDLWMSWYTEFGDVERVAYSIPQTINSWVVDADPTSASRAFGVGAQLCLTVHGCEGTLDDEPAFAAHVASLAALRARCAERYAAGRFRGIDGLAIRASGPGMASRFESPAGAAVVLTAPGEADTVEVELDPGARPAEGTGVLYRADGRVETVPTTDRVSVALDRDEVAVWYPSVR